MSKDQSGWRRLLAISVALLILATACTNDDRRPIRLAPISSTAVDGVRAIVDNCAGPLAVELSVRDEVLWRIESPELQADPDVDQTQTVSETDLALEEFLIGLDRPGWDTTNPLEQTLEEGTRYTVSTQPDGQSIDFSLPDLRSGLLFNGVGQVQFNDDLLAETCPAPTDFGALGQSFLLFSALWVVAGGLVLTSIIVVLYLLSRRFGRLRTVS